MILRGLVASLCLTSVADAQQVPPKAVPVEEETDPGPAPVPQVRKALPVPDAAPEPVPPKGKPVPAPAPRGPAVPKTPEDDLFDYCELLYSKTNYGLALQQYEQYLNLHPAGKHREEVIFKMGECRYMAEAWDQALAVYDQYLRDFPNGKNRAVALYHAGEAHYKIASARAALENQTDRIRLAYEAYRAAVAAAKTGPYACYAAFRLGSFSYNAAQKEPERYKEAVRWFGIAAAQAPKSQPRIKVTSLFYLGRSQRYLRDNKAAAATFTELTTIKEDNIYFDQAWQELAQMDVEAGRTEEAMKKFQRLSRESVDAETRASSLVNAGMIHADAGRTEEAITNFEEALKVPGDKARSARARARFGLVWSSYKVKAHEKVVKAWRELQGEDGDLDEYSRARLWLIVGTSYAALDMHSPAARTLQLLENLVNSPEKAVIEACQEGGYKRIVSLFKLNDPATVDAVDDFVRIWQERVPEAAWLDKAWLVKGAWYFNRSVWDHAAKAYKNVRGERLEKDRLATWLYQRGCAEASSGDGDAVSTLTSFLEKAPADERASMARLQRAMVRLKLDDLTNALTDFEAVATDAAGTDTGETAAYNAARVKGIKQDYPGMIAGFTKLLTDYPKTRAAAEANYWIGTGNYQLQKYKECLAPLRTARSLDGKSYFEDASLMVIAALAAQQDVVAAGAGLKDGDARGRVRDEDVQEPVAAARDELGAVVRQVEDPLGVAGAVAERLGIHATIVPRVGRFSSTPRKPD